MGEEELLRDRKSDAQRGNSVGNGFLLWLALLVVTGLLLAGICTVLPSFRNGLSVFIALCQPGFWQLLSVLPAFFILRKRHYPETAKGLLISACCLFILNAICSGALFFSSRR